MKYLKLLFVLVVICLFSMDGFSQKLQTRIGAQLVSRSYLGKAIIPGIFIETRKATLTELIGNDAIKVGGYAGYGQYNFYYDWLLDDDRYSTGILSFGGLATISPLKFLPDVDLKGFDPYLKISTGYNWYLNGYSSLDFGWNSYFSGAAVGASYQLSKLSVFAEAGRLAQGSFQVGIAFGGGGNSRISGGEE